MKKVLIITYYWPPAGGIEVYRVVKFCKYLREFGWEPAVLTVQGGTAQASDPKLMEETAAVSIVEKAASMEPHTLFYALAGQKKKKVDPAAPATPPSKFIHQLGEFVRLNLFIPDARIGWYPAAVRKGQDMVQSFQPDAIFSTAPPYTVHLIASTLHRKTQVPWVADFRDPWVENYAYNTTYRFPWVRAVNQFLEKRVLNQANRVVVATPGQQRLQGAKARDGEARFTTITNGYDSDEIPADRPNDSFMLSYFGSLSAQRIPLALFSAVRELISEEPAFASDFIFRFAGRMTPEARSIIQAHLPESHCRILPLLPHDEYEKLVVEHQVLLVLVDQVPHNDMIIPAKCFEMMTTGNPLLAIAPRDGNTDNLLQATASGQTVAYDRKDEMKDALKAHYQAWTRQTLNRGSADYPAYHRKNLTGQLADVLNSVV